MRKYFLCLITAIAIMFAMPITAFAASDNVKIIDDAGLLSTEETNELEAYLEGLDSSVNYLAVTCEDRVYGNTAREKLDNYYRNYFQQKLLIHYYFHLL